MRGMISFAAIAAMSIAVAGPAWADDEELVARERGEVRADVVALIQSGAIGNVIQVEGDVAIQRHSGQVARASVGTPVYLGDTIETSANGAANIGFIDQSTFAVSENARIGIDEFVYDPPANAGAQDFSLLRRIFIATSSLIGRSNPDSVDIDTPVGSLGIRG